MDTQPAHSNRRAIRGPKVPPTRYVLILRLCQDKVSPLDGVTLSCCPKALLQLATQCCTRDPARSGRASKRYSSSCKAKYFSQSTQLHTAPAHDGRSKHSRGGATPLRGRCLVPSRRKMKVAVLSGRPLRTLSVVIIIEEATVAPKAPVWAGARAHTRRTTRIALATASKPCVSESVARIPALPPSPGSDTGSAARV